MGPTAWLVLPGVLVFAGASFFFALAESALFALGKWRARQMAERPGGAVVLRLLEQPGELLATIVLGNTAANGAIVALALWPVLLGQWPASWLVGLGTPWNTLQPSGTLQLSSAGLVAEAVQGRWTFGGQGELQLRGLASSLSTLEELGSYRLQLQGDARGDAAQLQLSTLAGALQLSGSGQWAASKLRFNGQASAAPGSESALGNLLNIIGRRQGALSLISIG